MQQLFQKYKYSLHRSRKTFHNVRNTLIKYKSRISEEIYAQLKQSLSDLKEAIDQKDRQRAFAVSKKLETLTKGSVKKTPIHFINEWVLGIGFTLLTVTLINQMWFQHYQIPSGSMRPTLMEKDRVIATKSCFGINFPFRQAHLLFDQKSLKRGNLAIFTTDNLPIEENQSRYLFLFKTKKQMVKRLIGRPGDTLYFYGGKVYGLDRNKEPIADFQESEIFKKLEHIPFSQLEGTVVTDQPSSSSQVHQTTYITQMGKEVAKLYVNSHGSLQGKLSNGHQWVEESPKLEYQELWGIKNYAMARMLNRQQALELGYDLQDHKQQYFLELRHSPHTSFPRPHLGVDLYGRLRPMLSPEKSLIPLETSHLNNLKQAMQTARFVIKNGRSGNYSIQRKFEPHAYSPHFENVADGTYEFIEGKAYQVKSSGAQLVLPSSHPLNQSQPELIQKLFNLGVAHLTFFEPAKAHSDFVPNRYAYFRDGSLHLLNNEIFAKDDPLLTAFINSEKTKARGFIDHGSPIKEGKLDKELIINYGLHIPNGYYLFLGDNHAESRDCRDFGFIPEKNIQGSPALIIWPASSRLGLLNQAKLNWLNAPNLLVWFAAATCLTAAALFAKRNRKKEL